MIKTNIEETKEQLQEELRKTREELDIQKWSLEKTLNGMKVLVKEITQNKKDLQNKNEELEKMNKLMIGRELKMIELKKELSLEKSKNLQK